MKKTLLLTILLILFCYHSLALCNDEAGGKSDGKDTTAVAEAIREKPDTLLNALNFDYSNQEVTDSLKAVKNQIDGIEGEIKELKAKQKSNFWISLIPLLVLLITICYDRYVKWQEKREKTKEKLQKIENVRNLFTIELKKIYEEFWSFNKIRCNEGEFFFLQYIHEKNIEISTNIYNSTVRDLSELDLQIAETIVESYILVEIL